MEIGKVAIRTEAEGDHERAGAEAEQREGEQHAGGGAQGGAEAGADKPRERDEGRGESEPHLAVHWFKAEVADGRVGGGDGKEKREIWSHAGQGKVIPGEVGGDETEGRGAGAGVGEGVDGIGKTELGGVAEAGVVVGGECEAYGEGGAHEGKNKAEGGSAVPPRGESPEPPRGQGESGEGEQGGGAAAHGEAQEEAGGGEAGERAARAGVDCDDGQGGEHGKRIGAADDDFVEVGFAGEEGLDTAETESGDEERVPAEGELGEIGGAKAVEGAEGGEETEREEAEDDDVGGQVVAGEGAVGEHQQGDGHDPEVEVVAALVVARIHEHGLGVAEAALGLGGGVGELDGEVELASLKAVHEEVEVVGLLAGDAVTVAEFVTGGGQPAEEQKDAEAHEEGRQKNGGATRWGRVVHGTGTGGAGGGLPLRV